MRVYLRLELFDAGARDAEPFKLRLERAHLFVRHGERSGGARGRVLEGRAVPPRRFELTRRSRDIRLGPREPRRDLRATRASYYVRAAPNALTVWEKPALLVTMERCTALLHRGGAAGQTSGESSDAY